MDKAIKIIQYTSNIPEAVWQVAEPFVSEAAEYSHDEFTSRHVYEGLKADLMQIWLVYVDGDLRFVWVTEIQQQLGGKRIVIVIAASGAMQYGWRFWPYMSQWMIGNAIEEAQVCCRPSMARLLRRHGLNTLYEVLTIKPMGYDYEQ